MKIKFDEIGPEKILEVYDPKTGMHGFVLGDIAANPLKQIITACAEGAIAATSVYNQIEEKWMN